MSDLSNFFAKRDRKKKKGAVRGAAGTATASAAAAPSVAADRKSNAAQGTEPQAAPQKQSDDGWIEIDDPKTAQVNTGGRTVGQFKRLVLLHLQQNGVSFCCSSLIVRIFG